MQQDRKAWAGIPIGLDNKVVAVIYLDSTNREFFGNANSSRRKILDAAIVGVAQFIRNA